MKNLIKKDWFIPVTISSIYLMLLFFGMYLNEKYHDQVKTLMKQNRELLEMNDRLINSNKYCIEQAHEAQNGWENCINLTKELK